MSDKHRFFNQWVDLLLPSFERPEAEELIYQLIDGFLNKTRLQFWDITSSIAASDLTKASQKFKEAIPRLIDQEPVQYILGFTYFLDYKLKVTPNVLIPRQETEELAAKIIKLERLNKGLSVLDIGTGTGCLPIALASELNCERVMAIDLSAQALDVAIANAQVNNVNIQFEQLDILKEALPNRKFDFIVSNPPYVLESDKKNMQANVLLHEPGMALFVPDQDPLRFYMAIADKALQSLKPNGRLYFEVHERFGQEVKLMLESKGFKNVEIHQDFLLSKDRMVFSKRG